MMVLLDGSNLGIEDVVRVAAGGPVELAPAAKERINRCRRFIEHKLERQEVMYGVNTGVGDLSEVILSPERLKDFQRYIVCSHSAGCGNPLPVEVVRAAICSRINTLAKGHSGVRLEIVETLVEMLNRGLTPVVLEKGSVGACGDLAPMSQVALVLIGEGEAHFAGRVMPGREAMAEAGIKCVEFEARDGLATINGSNMTAGWGALLLDEADRYFRTSEIATALTFEALNANIAACDERIHRVRGYPGAVACAANIRRLVEGSDMLDRPGKRVQDAYSLRSTPQVVGAAKDAWQWARRMFEIELNGAGDNPIFIPEDDVYLTGANFQGTPLALGLDSLGTTVTMLAVMAERRTNRLMNHHLSNGLPPFLAPEAGVFSGLMLTQYTQGMLVCENRILAAPAAIGSISGAADQEDFVSMSFTAAIKARQILTNAWYVIAIELIASAQAVEFRKPVRLGRGTRVAHDIIRRHVEPLVEDRPVHKDINRLAEAISANELLAAVEQEIGRLES